MTGVQTCALPISSIDTLDYSGEGLNTGSKVVIAAAGGKCRALATTFESTSPLPLGITNIKLVAPGILAISCTAFESYEKASTEMEFWSKGLKDVIGGQSNSFPLLILCDDADFVADTYNNFLWSTFTRANPSHDIYGIDSFTKHKHWGCKGPLMIDTRIKPHHAPPLILDEEVERKVDVLFSKHPELSKL